MLTYIMYVKENDYARRCINIAYLWRRRIEIYLFETGGVKTYCSSCVFLYGESKVFFFFVGIVRELSSPSF